MDRALHLAESGSGQDERRAAEFRRARRHSRRVLLLKVALPLVALLILAGGIGATWLARNLPDDVTARSVGLENGRVVMQDPRLSGTDGSDRPYTMVARRAIQSLGGGGIELEGVTAHLGVGDDGTAEIDAAKGLYDAGAQTLRLYDGLEVTTSDGMVIQLSGADMKLDAGSMEGTGPVRIRTPSQTVEAGTLSVGDRGQSLSFRGGVKMTLLPSADGGPVSSPSADGGPVPEPSDDGRPVPEPSDDGRPIPE